MGEATYEVRPSASAARAREAREALIEALENARFPVADVNMEQRGKDTVESVAGLVAALVAPKEPNAVAAAL